MKQKRGIIITDTHCGDDLGLTPQKYIRQHRPTTKAMLDFWQWFVREIKDCGRFDVCIDLGDCVNGNPKNNSRSLVTNDMSEQVEIAIETRKIIVADTWRFCYGTDCHVGGSEDYEKRVAQAFGGSITTEQLLDINGCTISAMHKRGFGKSSNPAGAGSSLGKAGINTFIEEKKRSDKTSQILLSGHVHNFEWYGNPYYQVMSCPPLQIAHRDSTPYARGFVSSYDVGFLTFTIDKKGYFVLDKPHIFVVTLKPKKEGRYEKIK